MVLESGPRSDPWGKKADGGLNHPLGTKANASQAFFGSQTGLEKEGEKVGAGFENFKKPTAGGLIRGCKKNTKKQKGR